MTARQSHVDVSETAKMRTSSTRNSSENTDPVVDDDAEDFDDAPVTMTQDPLSTVELLSVMAAAIDRNASQSLKKRFQITRIVQAENAGDSTDDVDDTAGEPGSSLRGTDDAHEASGGGGGAQSTEDATHHSSSVDESALCQKHLFQNPSRLTRTRPSDINSRFKIVKIESNKPLRRGRWTCFEFVDPPPLEKIKCNDAGTTGSVMTSPIYYIQMEKEDPSENQFAAIVYSDGHPSLDPNPLPFAEGAMCPSSCSIVSESFVFPALTQTSDRCIQSPTETSDLSSQPNDRELAPTISDDQHPVQPPYLVHSQLLNSFRDGRDALVNGVSCASDELICLKSDDQHITVIRAGSEPLFVHSKVSDAMSSPLLTIVPVSADTCTYEFAENEISGGICALDNKIEQAMDLVKSHLMFAVHEEVELLKDQIKELTIKKGHLEYENRVLRASATQETLEKLHHTASSSSSTDLS